MKVFEETKNWGDAETTCIANGGYLATIKSDTQNDWIISQTSTSIADWPTVWHGATDQFSEGTWTDAVGQSALSFTSWASEELLGIGGNCAVVIRWQEMVIDGSKWYDLPCSVVATHFVCELKSGKKPYI